MVTGGVSETYPPRPSGLSTRDQPRKRLRQSFSLKRPSRIHRAGQSELFSACWRRTKKCPGIFCTPNSGHGTANSCRANSGQGGAGPAQHHVGRYHGRHVQRQIAAFLATEQEMQHAAGERPGVARRGQRVEPGAQGAFVSGLLVDALDLVQESLRRAANFILHRGKFVDVFAARNHDFEHLADYRAIFQDAEKLLDRSLDGIERVADFGGKEQGVGSLDQRRENVFAHGEEQFRLVGKMPVNSAARDAGCLGDLIERGAANSAFMKHPTRCVDDVLAGFVGLFLGFSDHLYLLAYFGLALAWGKPDFTQKNVLHTFMNVYNRLSENNQGECP